ncbi:RidA family protein [Robertkochia marina]|uniref:RidA family protein n=1 Tax=Robertkochia marina TaxID=1227945 RepID=A0A4S3M1A9_9FLAO|nr:Rid family detoxifying hydrolase [Robertkochia marina]THD66753.1 RidA family protein [Robertkochia marina]TRZ42357.1 RidA family protein [Robertkochia marina]
MKTIIKTDRAPAPIGPYNQAVLANDTLYISGQIGIDPATNELIQGGVEEETKQVMKNLEAILKAAGMEFENVVKSTIFLSNIEHYRAVNGIYGAYIAHATAPAREAVEVSNLPKMVNVEISMIAVK